VGGYPNTNEGKVIAASCMETSKGGGWVKKVLVAR
jgi:hypothetical protein